MPIPPSMPVGVRSLPGGASGGARGGTWTPGRLPPLWRAALDDSALDPPPGLVDVDHVPQRGDLSSGITAHDEDIGLASDEQATRHRADPDRVGGTRSAGHDG